MTETLADDLLTGREAIGRFLGWEGRRVSRVAEAGGTPIKKIRGVGIVASKTALISFFRGDSSESVDRPEGGA